MPNLEFYNPGEVSAKRKVDRNNAVQRTRVEKMKDDKEITKVWKKTGILPKIFQGNTLINQFMDQPKISGDELETLMDYYETEFMFDEVDYGEYTKKVRVARPQNHFIAFLYKHGYLNNMRHDQFNIWSRDCSEDLKNAVQYCIAKFENNNLSGGSKRDIPSTIAELALKRNDYRYKEQDVTLNVNNADPIDALSDEKILEMLNSGEDSSVNMKIDYKDFIDVDDK